MKNIKFEDVKVGDIIHIEFLPIQELVKKLGWDPDNPGQINSFCDLSGYHMQLATQGATVCVTGTCEYFGVDEDDDEDGPLASGFEFLDPYSKEWFHCYPDAVKSIKLISKSKKHDFQIITNDHAFVFAALADLKIGVVTSYDESNHAIEAYAFENDGECDEDVAYFCFDEEFTLSREDAMKLYENLGTWLNMNNDISMSKTG